MSKNNKKTKEEPKTPSAEVSKNETEAEFVQKVEAKKDAPVLHVSIETLTAGLLAIEHGNREIDLAVLEAMKHLEKVLSLVTFIEKAQKAKK